VAKYIPTNISVKDYKIAQSLLKLQPKMSEILYETAYSVKILSRVITVIIIIMKRLPTTHCYSRRYIRL